MPKQQLKQVDVEKRAQPKAELAINPEKLFFIIVKAREFDVKVPPAELDQGSNTSDEQGREVLEDYRSDPTYAELRDAIDGLNTDEKADLVALMWIGRGDYEPGEWKSAHLLALGEQHNVALYLTGTPLLSDLLEDGLDALGYSVEEFEFNRL